MGRFPFVYAASWHLEKLQILQQNCKFRNKIADFAIKNASKNASKNAAALKMSSGNCKIFINELVWVKRGGQRRYVG